MSDPGALPVDVELAEENRLLREWYVIEHCSEFQRSPGEFARDQWRRLRRRPTQIGKIDKQLQLQTLALAALLEKASSRGGISSPLRSSIAAALARERVRRRLVRIPEQEIAAATLLSSTGLIPALGEIVEGAGMLRGRFIWQMHTWHLGGLARKVLLEQGLPDPIDEKLPAASAPAERSRAAVHGEE